MEKPMITAADIAVYNKRRARLREKGIALIPDLYGQDELDDGSGPTGAPRFWRRHAAETVEYIAAERAASGRN